MHTRKHGLIRVAGVLSFGIFITLSYLFVNPTTINSGLATLVYAEGNDTPATSGTPLPSLVTLNIDLTHPNASVELTPHDNTGTFSSSSEDNSVAFNVSTNNYTGYTLYISSSSNDGYLSPTGITTPTTENSLSSIDEITTESDFSNPSSTTLNNKWGYKPSKYNSETNTSFIPAPSITNPTTGSAILDTTATYNTTKAGDPITTETNTEDIDANAYTIALGARVDHTVATGSYEGTFVLQVVGNPVPVTITYTDTSGDNTVTSTLPAKYEGAVSDTNAPISTTIPTRTGYTFKSWCLREVTTGISENNYVDTCTGTTYNASNSTDGTQYIGVDLTHSNTMTLVAMWERNKYTQTVQVRYQDTTGTYGNYGTYVACTAEVYYGMTHSCNINATTEYKASSLASYTVTGANTKQMDVARQTYQQTIQIRYQNASGGWGSYGDYSSCTKAVYYGANHSCSYGGDTTYAAASVLTYQVTGDNTKYMDAYRNTRTVSLSKGTGVSNVTVTGTGVKSGSGTASATAYYGGAVTITATMSSGYDWVNWTGSATYSNRAQSISSVTSNLSFTANGQTSKTYIQNITKSSCPTSRTLVYDSRDEQGYYIQKIGSTCWMTSNLNIAGGTKLTPEKSNVASNYTLSASSTSDFSIYNSASYYGVYNSGSTDCGANSPCYSYYSYGSATAGTNPSSGSATYDICPKGWRLPVESEFSALVTTDNTYGWTFYYVSSSFYDSKAGSYYDGFGDGGSKGIYWTSSVDNRSGGSSNYALYYTFNDTTYCGGSYGHKKFGISVRCVAK